MADERYLVAQNAAEKAQFVAFDAQTASRAASATAAASRARAAAMVP